MQYSIIFNINHSIIFYPSLNFSISPAAGDLLSGSSGANYLVDKSAYLDKVIIMRTFSKISKIKVLLFFII